MKKVEDDDSDENVEINLGAMKIKESEEKKKIQNAVDPKEYFGK